MKARQNKTINKISNPKIIVRNSFSSLAMIIIVTSIIVLLSANRCEARRESSRYKACFSNIRMLMCAVEMYNMDNQTEMTEINNTNIELLIKEKYLINISPPERKCKYMGYDLTGKGHIYCVYHGDIEHHSVNGQLAPY